MHFPTPYIRHFCLSRSSCSFLLRRPSFCWPPLAQEAHPFTSIAYHFDKHLIRILVNTSYSHGMPARQDPILHPFQVEGF